MQLPTTCGLLMTHPTRWCADH